MKGLIDVVNNDHSRKGVIYVFKKFRIFLFDMPLHKAEVLHLEVASCKTTLPIKSKLEVGIIWVDSLYDPVCVRLLSSSEDSEVEVGI